MQIIDINSKLEKNKIGENVDDLLKNLNILKDEQGIKNIACIFVNGEGAVCTNIANSNDILNMLGGMSVLKASIADRISSIN